MSSMCLLRETVDATTTLVLQMATWLAFTPLLLALLTCTVTTMNSVQGWPATIMISGTFPGAHDAWDAYNQVVS